MAIVKPTEMDFSDKNIVMIISGLPGVGKTTLALSAPDVVLIDTDEGMARVNPAHRKDSSICKTYEEILDDVKACEGHYKTVVIDTAGALLDYMKDWAIRTDPKASKASGGFSLQGFGIIKQEFLRLSAELRKKFNVIFLFHEAVEKNNEDIFYSLVCEGSARTLVWQPADLGAHMFVQNDERYLGFSPTASYTAKAAYGIKGLVKVPELKEGDSNKFLTTLFAKVRANLEKESKELAPQQEIYEKAIDQGEAIINEVNAVEDITKCQAALRDVKHALTSKAELNTRFKARLAELNIKWNKETKAYEQQ